MSLAKEHGVDVVLVVDSDYPNDHWGYAITHPVHEGKRAVVISHPPTRPLAYMVAMHELGHCIRGPGWSADLFLDREAAAWEWALDNAKLPVRIAATHALAYMEASARESGVLRTDAFDRVRRRLKRAVLN